MVVYTDYTDLYEIYGWMALCMSFIVLYGKLRSICPNWKDPLMTEIGFYNLDMWSMSHLGWYAFLGYCYPEHSIELFCMGVTWEGIEHIMGKYRPSWMGGFGDCPNNINALTHTDWWYGRSSDIIMNILGFYLGQYVSQNNFTLLYF